MKSKKALLLILLSFNTLCCISTPLYSDAICSPLPNQTSLSSYIRQALENNSELEAAFYDWQSNLYETIASDTLPDPKLSYGHYIQEVETRVGPQKNSVGIHQTIPWLGKLTNRKKLARKKSLIAEQKLYVLTAKLIRKLKDSFYSYYFLDRSIQIGKENIVLVDLLEKVAQRQVQVGGSSADAIQAQIEINKLYDDVEALWKNEHSLIAKIFAILNASPKPNLPLPTDLFANPLHISTSLTIEELQWKNPTLILLSLQAEKEKANYKLVYQDRYPDVTIGVDWIETGRAIAPTPDNGKDPVVAKVSLNVPIWFSTYKARENAAKSQVVSAREMLNQKSQEIVADYEDIIQKYQDAERRIILYRDTLLPQAEQALSILTTSYKTGKTEFDRVLESQRVLLRFQLEYERALVDQAKAVDAYEELIGACK
ncbi:MAG: hypothetical protein K940chlam7_01032 [Chlamydiae bacterium]|nr:hypothetical protein [Chlamydiota bacterium]